MMKICLISGLFGVSLTTGFVAPSAATFEKASDRAEIVFGYPTLSDAVTATQSECMAKACVVEVGASPSLWDHPLIIDLIHADRDLQLDHRTSAYLTVEETPRMQSILAFCVGSETPASD